MQAGSTEPGRGAGRASLSEPGTGSAPGHGGWSWECHRALVERWTFHRAEPLQGFTSMRSPPLAKLTASARSTIHDPRWARAPMPAEQGPCLPPRQPPTPPVPPAFSTPSDHHPRHPPTPRGHRVQAVRVQNCTQSSAGQIVVPHTGVHRCRSALRACLTSTPLGPPEASTGCIPAHCRNARPSRGAGSTVSEDDEAPRARKVALPSPTCWERVPSLTAPCARQATELDALSAPWTSGTCPGGAPDAPPTGSGRRGCGQ